MYTVVCGFCVILLVSLLRHIVNQLCLSPLRRFPGPKLCSISRLPFSWYTATGRKAAWVHRLHLKYGDAVRIAPDEISWTNPEAWSDIYGHPSAQQSGTLKDPRFYGEAANGAQDIIRANFTDHSRFRRGFSHAFSERTMASYEPLLRTQVERLVEGVRSSLAADARRPIDLTQAFDLTTFDVMNEFCFGKPLYMHEKTENHEWMKSLHACAKAVGLFRIARYSPWASMLLPFFVPLSLVRKYRASFRLCAENVNIKMGSLTGDDKNRRDLWSRLVDLPENAQFSREEMHANSVIMMLAGAETTATLLTGLVYYLLTCEGPLDKLLTEIRGAFHSASEINFRALSQLPYLQACIDEGLRLFPPVPVGNARLVPPEGRVICGSLIPAKTVVSVYGGAASWSPRNFSQPDEFIPERWLRHPDFAADQLSASQPFSWGPRNCVGKNFAYHEARIILATFLWHFDLRLSEDCRGWVKSLREYGVWDKVPLMVYVHPREINTESSG